MGEEAIAGLKGEIVPQTAGITICARSLMGAASPLFNAGAIQLPRAPACSPKSPA